MTIVWRDSLSIGYKQIDLDHQQLFELINSVEIAVKNDLPRRKLVIAIEDLFAYTKRHFSFEERLMADAKYGSLDRHKVAHAELIDQLDNAARPILDLSHGESDTTLKIPQENLDALIGLLRHWLVDHIIKEDMLLKSVL